MVYGNMKMWIGGEWVDAESGKTFSTVNAQPANLGDGASGG